MRIVIDMQGAQTESRFRGIGRYVMSFAQAVARNIEEHDLFLVLSSYYPETIQPIRDAFYDLLPRDHIRIWHAPGQVSLRSIENAGRNEISELLREDFILRLNPDIVHITSLFEGYVDDAVASIGRIDSGIPVSVTLYDLIPYLNPGEYTNNNSQFEAYYSKKIEDLKKAQLCLSISDYTRREALANLPFNESQIVNVSTAVDEKFIAVERNSVESDYILEKFGINSSFILYTGGVDKRKNLPRLIEAFSKLDVVTREGVQLVFAGNIPEPDKEELLLQASSCELESHELCLTGYVDDDDLIALYTLCTAFVFPSWHEGFGLPALEAMACGAAVIASNSTSLPEVIANDEAMFDPFDVDSIAQKIEQVIVDRDFRSRLKLHGLNRAEYFSWDETAKKSVSAWERVCSKKLPVCKEIPEPNSTTHLIYEVASIANRYSLSNLEAISIAISQNQNSGLQRQLMVDVSELCQRDSATGVQRVVRSYLSQLLRNPPQDFRIEPVYATTTSGYRYARKFVREFLDLDEVAVDDEPIRWKRGDIFFGLDMQHHVQLNQMQFYDLLRLEGVTVKFLIYDLLPIQLDGYFSLTDSKALHEKFLRMVADTDGAICISQATADSYKSWLVENHITTGKGFQLTPVHIGGDINSSKPSKGLPDNAEEILEHIRKRITFVCISTIEPRKKQEQILDAMELLWNEGSDLNIVLVGQKGWKIDQLAERIHSHREYNVRLFWLQGVSDEYLSEIYSACTCLIVASINEGFGLPLIEASQHGLPVIARDIPVFREVAGDYAYYFSGDSPHELGNAIKGWLALFSRSEHPTSSNMAWLTWEQSTEKLLDALVHQNYRHKQLLVDISELVQRDAQSGIQRVVRSILREWLQHPHPDYRIEPVYATTETSYKYARKFMLEFSGSVKKNDDVQDEFVEIVPGDIFFGLDFQPQVVPANRAFFQCLRNHGVSVSFLLHDLLCIQMPHFFPPGSAEGFKDWLDVIFKNDGVVCVSETVAIELIELSEESNKRQGKPLEILWSHNGVDRKTPVTDYPSLLKLNPALESLAARNTFLMVGTIEPRKGHEFVLRAFENLWNEGHELNLFFVGKKGWMVDSLVSEISQHPELNIRLFWLESVSDEYLNEIYRTSTCLIAASYGEGFGLPLIEAAQNELPIIARDIPIFREVAAEGAFYFDNTDTPMTLSVAVKAWLRQYAEDSHPDTRRINYLSWDKSAHNLLEKLVLL